MHKILAIITLKLKETLKSPLALIFLFVMPIIFSFIFGSAASDTKKPTVAFVSKSSTRRTKSGNIKNAQKEHDISLDKGV